ncbi:zinc finger protein 32-like [Colias croceus]|uniref:zinc finger protein 32-like n=1 Tax=Colias crocea TaxID=72248 RepID=UPI001E27F9D4|nr:zinc finger protein 32-like [Colias croceus]
MSSDEETFVIIVGDDDYEIPDSVKDVVENSEITHLTSLDEIETENVEIKEEPEDYFFKEEPVDDLDEEYAPKSETSSDDDYSDDDINNVNRSRRKRVKVITSYVQELREAYPELRNDRKMLINILSQIMKAMKPPPLPRDYFIMNGIMLECIECGKLSNGIPAAGRHYQEYHGERYLICFACGVDFRSPTNLYKHEKRCPAPDIGIVLKARARHIGNKARARPFLSYEKPKERTDDWMCSMCPARYSSAGGLEAHELVHAGLRPHRCTCCDHAYTSRSALLRHARKHSGERYTCDHCGRDFSSKTAIAAHMDTHLPLKKYACTECEKRYAQKSALRLHVRRDHRRLPPPCACQLCPRRYPRMSLLKQHMKKAHGLLLMTRKMYYKMLPTLTDSQVEQAKVVLQSQVETGTLLDDLCLDTDVKQETDYFIMQD